MFQPGNDRDCCRSNVISMEWNIQWIILHLLVKIYLILNQTELKNSMFPNVDVPIKNGLIFIKIISLPAFNNQFFLFVLYNNQPFTINLYGLVVWAPENPAMDRLDPESYN